VAGMRHSMPLPPVPASIAPPPIKTTARTCLASKRSSRSIGAVRADTSPTATSRSTRGSRPSAGVARWSERSRSAMTGDTAEKARDLLSREPSDNCRVGH
jgi:hypothetical protein